MGIVTSTLRSVNAWAHLPSTLRAGYVLGWGALFGANVSHRQSSEDQTLRRRIRGLLLESEEAEAKIGRLCCYRLGGEW
jgi:hypothetical protein